MNNIKKYININNIKIIIIFIYIFIVIFGASYNYIYWGTTEFQSKFQHLTALLILFKHKYIFPLLLIVDIIQLVKKDERNNIKKNIMVFILFIFVQFILKYFSNYEIFEELINIIYFSRNINYKYIVSMYVIVVIAVFTAMFVAYKNDSLIFENKGRGFALGFRHSNCLGIYSCSLFMALSYIVNKKSVSFILFVPTILINYYFSKSRTSFIVAILFIILFFIFNSSIKNKIHNKIILNFIKIIFISTPILLTVISIILGILISKNYIVVDGNFAIRFLEAVYAFNEKGLSLFVSDYSNLGRIYCFDNCYIGLIFKYGIITFLIFIILWTLVNIRIVKTKNYSLAAIAISIYVHMCMEFLIPYCFMPIFMSYILSNNKSVSTKIEEVI